jgi:hypothetical protein
MSKTYLPKNEGPDYILNNLSRFLGFDKIATYDSKEIFWLKEFEFGDYKEIMVINYNMHGLYGDGESILRKNRLYTINDFEKLFLLSNITTVKLRKAYQKIEKKHQCTYDYNTPCFCDIFAFWE